MLIVPPMNNDMATLQIPKTLHHQIKLAATKRQMKIQEFVVYVIRKGMNLTSRKQP